MILGMGIDLVDCRRLESAFEKHGEKFVNRVFTKQEQQRCFSRKQVWQSFGKIFAAKEAVVKAISNTKGITWQDIEIKKSENGKPVVNLTGKGLRNYKALIPNGMHATILLSLTDEPPYAQACAIIASV